MTTDDRTPIEVLARKIAEGETLTQTERDVVSKLVMAVGQQFYEQTGVMFIAGYYGKIEGGLPERVTICPGYGADARSSAVYVRAVVV